jgi:hypothetical protein
MRQKGNRKIGIMERWNAGFKKIQVVSLNITQYSIPPKFHHSIGHSI